jgi:glycosyltransferase involved in cell wall biosynthesis
MITAITPTGDRPLAFALCQNWMRNQTRQPEQWLVIDDGKIPTSPLISMEYVRREPRRDDPRHTLILNLKAALSLIKGDIIMIIEDDEYYAPEYIAEMERRLSGHEVAGIMRSKYYHLYYGGFFRHGNVNRASLAQTAFKKSFLPEFEKLLYGDSFLDMRLWARTKPDQRYLFTDDNNPLYLGIKGLPGRGGIGSGHKITYGNYALDTSDRRMLRMWVPRDYVIYLDILTDHLTAENCKSYFHFNEDGHEFQSF